MTTMKKIFILAVAALVALAPLPAQTRADVKSAQKDAAAAAKMLRKEGFKPVELGDVQSRLEKYFLKANAGCTQVVGIADLCMSTNLAQVTALANAANQYAMLAGGKVRGRIVSSVSSLTGQQVDNIVSSFERLVQRDIRGELVTYVTVVRTKGGRVSARVYCLADHESAALLRRRALELALEEQSLAVQYGSMVGDWIDEGFEKAGEQ